MKIIGSGEIEEVTKGKVYRIRHHLGRDPKTGRYIRSPKKTVYGTKADARRALEEYRIELECGVKNPEELTVGNYARAWYERRKNTGRYSPLTLKDDELQVRKIEDIWGTTLLEDLTLKKISDAYDKLLASKRATKSAVHKINAGQTYVIDHHSAAGAHAVERYWDEVFAQRPPYPSLESFFCDSLEYEVSLDWTLDCPQEFLKRRGYSILPYLPVIGLDRVFPCRGGELFTYLHFHDWILTKSNHKL